MDTSVLVGGPLTEKMKDDGRTIVKELDRINLLIKGAFWLYVKPDNEWKLILVSPETAVKGPRHVYRRVRASIQKVTPDLPLSCVGLMEAAAPVYIAIRSMVRTLLG